jgi:uncharacterized protein
MAFTYTMPRDEYSGVWRQVEPQHRAHFSLLFNFLSFFLGSFTMNRLASVSLSSRSAQQWAPPIYTQSHVYRQFDEVLSSVSEAISPVWPLNDYVAVNPYMGVSSRPFLDARAFLRVFSDCETLMSLEHYAHQFHQHQFNADDIEAAIGELQSSGVHLAVSPSEVVEKLQAASDDLPTSPASDKGSNSDRRIRTIAEYVDMTSSICWSEAIVDEVSKHCAAHYDDGQAAWASPWKHLPLYQAWRSSAEYDRNIEILGLKGCRAYVAKLPHTPEAAIIHSLQRLGVPQPLWTMFLLCQAFSIPGWSAWAKYQDHRQTDVENKELAGLLAIRLAYDAALAEAITLRVKWDSLFDNESVSFRPASTAAADDAHIRMVLLRASEIAYSKTLLQSLSHHQEATASRKLAQMIFCIDVRSERFRRHLEGANADIETFGFAGFFGMPIEYVQLGDSFGKSHVPVLLQSQFRLYEGLPAADGHSHATAVERRNQIRSWRQLWKDFQASAIGCFSFVETTGLFYGPKLLAGVMPAPVSAALSRLSRLAKHHQADCGPTLARLENQGVCSSRQTDLAEAMLKNLGLKTDFARLVVFCGHGSQTTNNPLAAGLDCGACGGHSGEPNARVAALLLNQPEIRQSLSARGIVIPVDTHFLAAVHNTTTDQLQFFDLAAVPAAHANDLEQLLESSGLASQQTRQERLPITQSNSIDELLQRASDWSETRPEWGLAGNAAFIAAPRSMTKKIDLDGRTFLHSYDHLQDPQGDVLETIMTAPMIVAHWINMQYYASTVDNDYFGSGNKTVHNVVGRFGILSGSDGDLMTGLPWQSLHDGEDYQHAPMRLQVIIAAPRAAVDRVVEKHELISNLLTGGWLHLTVLEHDQTYRYTEAGTWEADNAAVRTADCIGC